MLVEMGVRTPETRHEGLALGIETVECTSVTVGIVRTIHGRGLHTVTLRPHWPPSPALSLFVSLGFS